MPKVQLIAAKLPDFPFNPSVFSSQQFSLQLKREGILLPQLFHEYFVPSFFVKVQPCRARYVAIGHARIPALTYLNQSLCDFAFYGSRVGFQSMFVASICRFQIWYLSLETGETAVSIGSCEGSCDIYDEMKWSLFILIG